NVEVDGADTATYSGIFTVIRSGSTVVSGNGRLSKTGAGTLLLNPSNGSTPVNLAAPDNNIVRAGDTYIEQGTLTIATTDQFNHFDSSLGHGVIQIQNGATLELDTQLGDSNISYTGVSGNQIYVTDGGT